MSLRDLAIAALDFDRHTKPAESDCPSGATLGVPQRGSMEIHTSGAVGAHGAFGASGANGAVSCKPALSNPNIPPLFADAMVRLSCQTLPGIPPDWQCRAADMASMLLDLHGPALARLGWPVGAMFDSPVVLGTFGESAALDLRKAGLAWQMRQGDTITKLAPNGAVILRADSKTWPFLFTPAQGARPFFDCGPT